MEADFQEKGRKLVIRAFEKNDLEQVMGLWLEGNLQAHAFMGEACWREHIPAVREAIGQAEVYVYEERGQILGFIGLEDSYIAGIFVDSRARSKGIGRQLLETAKEGRESLSLYVYAKNIRAVRFYLREGFKRQEARMEEGQEEYRMVWRRG